MPELALDEQETTYTVEATDRKIVHVFSNDRVHQGRLEKLGIQPYRVDGYGKFYKVDLNEFSFGVRRKRQMSVEQRAAAGARFASYRESGEVDDSDEE
jgi:hypothetical protein